MIRMTFRFPKTKFRNIKVSTKIWIAQVKLPCGFGLKNSNENVETSNWHIWQVLN